MRYDEPKFKSLLRHEVLHLGYPRHDWAFRSLAQEKGIPLTGSTVEGGSVKVQIKQGARYVTVKTYESTEKWVVDRANEYAKHLARTNRGTKVRVS